MNCLLGFGGCRGRDGVSRLLGDRDPGYWLKILLCLFSTVLIQGGLGLKDVRLLLPEYVLDGSDARLSCKYNMEGDALYAVKWYKGSHEFYRYIPKEVPPIQVFEVTGLNVDKRRSNDHDVVLSRTTLDSGGMYTCVVSAESPFQTLSDSRELLVLLIGDDRPLLQLDRFQDRSQYHPGDSVTVHCHVPASLPSPPNITWYLNDQIISGGGDLVRRMRDPGLAKGIGLSRKTEAGTTGAATVANYPNGIYNNNLSSSSSSRKNISQYHQHNHQYQYQYPNPNSQSSLSGSTSSNNNRASASSSSPSSSSSASRVRDRDFVENGGMLESIVSFDLPGNVTPVQIKCRARIYTAYDQNVTIQIVPVPRRLSGPDTLLRSSGSSTLRLPLQIPPLLLRRWAWTCASSSSCLALLAVVSSVHAAILQVPV